MAEKETYTQNLDLPANSEAGSQAEVDVFNEWAARGAAERLMGEAPTQELFPTERQVAPQKAETTPSRQETPVQTRPSRGVTAVVGATLVASAVGVGVAAHEATKAPEFSEETTTYTVDQGDGMYDAAEEVKGVEDVRDAIDHIQADPANIDVLKDGLQPGEQLVIPVSVEGYKENK